MWLPIRAGAAPVGAPSMEMVLEQHEVEQLLREALCARKIEVPENLVLVLRQNHKKGSFRLVLRASALQESLTGV